MQRKLCRHCFRGLVIRPRGLCWKCYYKPGVLALYPSTSKYARRGTGCYDTKTKTQLPEPTQAIPGSPEKIAIIEQRLAAGLALHHPDDAKADPESSSETDWMPPRGKVLMGHRWTSRRSDAAEHGVN